MPDSALHTASSFGTVILCFVGHAKAWSNATGSLGKYFVWLCLAYCEIHTGISKKEFIEGNDCSRFPARRFSVHSAGSSSEVTWRH